MSYTPTEAEVVVDGLAAASRDPFLFCWKMRCAMTRQHTAFYSRRMTPWWRRTPNSWAFRRCSSNGCA